MIKRSGIKLAAAFFIIIAIFLIAFLISYGLIYNSFNKKGYFTFNNARLLTNGIIISAEKNYGEISDFKVFNANISPRLKKIKAKMKIIDLYGRIIFDSEDSNAFYKKNIVNIEVFIHYGVDFQDSNPGLMKLSFPLTVDGKQVANAVFVMPEGILTGENTQGKDVLVMLVPVIIGLSIVTLFLIVIIIRINKGILVPIKQLNRSANEIARGNLDIKLLYDSDNEIGEFTRAFDLMREELKDSLKKQREYERSRKELIAGISHDIKTPVASIKAYVEGLQDGIAKDPDTIARYVSVIRKKTDSLTKLVEDLFQHSLRELGQFRIIKEEKYSGKLLAGILEPLQFAEGTSGLIIEGAIPDILVNVDSGRIEQVILNLIQNAKKYTSCGGEVYFSAAVDNDFLRITIKDKGMGIPPEEIPFIFDQFYRGEKARSHSHEGVGLGLSICKYIVEEHGGEISVISRINEGSTFTFTIPKA